MGLNKLWIGSKAPEFTIDPSCASGLSNTPYLVDMLPEQKCCVISECRHLELREPASDRCAHYNACPYGKAVHKPMLYCSV